MKGIPSLAEEIMIARDLKLLEYAFSDGNFDPETPLLHFSLVSTKESVELIRKAKASGWPVSCDVAVHQLAFEDTDLMDFDTNLKVSPPFRSTEDRQALLAGLADGTIDCIVSDHNPQEEEVKNMEFDMADFGVSSIETVFSVAIEHSDLPLDKLVDVLTTVPRHILRQPQQSIAVGQKAALTLFDPEEKWTFNKTYSKSLNNPFIGRELRGKVKGIINNNTYRLF
jgi:dihydroorotase